MIDMDKQKQRIKAISAYWSVFYRKLEEWIDKDDVNKLDKSCRNDLIGWREYNESHDRLKVAAVKKHISSTHTWTKDVHHTTNKIMSGWYVSPFECSRCGLAAGEYEHIGSLVPTITNDIPSFDMHNQLIHRTCDEVYAARERARKTRKGGKCMQCGTYECLMRFE